jgi:glycosyltransferase involved in cell wall biosynthesis
VATKQKEVKTKRILVAMARYPFPPRSGSSLVAINSIRRLSKSHHIHYLCLGDKNWELPFDGIVDKAEIVTKTKPLFVIKLIRYVFMRLNGTASTNKACIFRELRERINRLMESEAFDVIVMFEFEAIQYCAPKFYDRLIVNIEDPYSIRIDRMRSLAVWPFWQRAVMFVDGLLARHYERSVLPRLGKVLLLSAADAKDMRERLGCENLDCVTYGADRPSVGSTGLMERDAGMIVFSGNMYHLPNVDGILYFLKNVFPLVLQGFPEARLWVVGSNPDARICEAVVSFGDRVVVTGMVNDMSEYLQKAMVSICPVRLKIGVQTKILEALALGTPVVTTSAGNSGISGTSGSELWVEDDPVAFAHRVVSLLRKQEWLKLSENGKKMVEDRFTWDRSAEELEQHIMSIQTVK